MLSWEDALSRVLERCRPPKESVEMAATEALGFALAEDVASDLDSPPFTKALVDGYAVRSSDLASGKAVLEVVEEITAGRTPTRAVEPGQTARVMTGAPIPDGADAMVMVEDSRLFSEGEEKGERVQLDAPAVVAGQHILPRGKEMQRGEQVLDGGQTIRPQEVGLLAAVGRTRVRVCPKPRVAILSTGDELVEPETVPERGQIRNSNGPMLSALVVRAGGEVQSVGIALDDREVLREQIAGALAADLVLISGGVSAGKLDLVPGVLEDLGVEQVFHKVSLKPGKPLWFGAASEATSTLVFGLPGNPVSGFVCFELFVRPAIRRLAGHQEALPVCQLARLTKPWQPRGQRAVFWPARLEPSPEGAVVTPLAWAGSADLRTVTQANCFLYSPEGDRDFQPSDVVEVTVW